MKCLVTGAAGFIGSHLCERLLVDGHQVIGFDNLSNGHLSNIKSILSHPNFYFQSGDITDVSVLVAMEDIDWCFHLAGLADVVPSIEAPTLYHKANVTGTINVLEAARCAKVKRFIYAASSSCYGIPDKYPTPEQAEIRPMYPYALTKYLGEQYVLHWAKTYKLPALSLRLFNVYGPRARTNGTYGAVFGVLLSQLANCKPLTVVGDGEQTRDFTFVTDVVDAFVKAAESNLCGVTMNVGSGRHHSVNKLIELLGAEDVEHIPDRPGEPRTTFANTAMIRLALGWEPRVSFEDGVAQMKANLLQYKDAPLWTKETIKEATKSWFEYLGG